MKIGITYDVKEEYGFEKLDLRFTDFLAMEEVSFIKESLEGLGHHVTLIGNVIALNEYLRKNTDLDLVFNMSWGYRGRNREGLIPAVLESYNIPYTGTDAYGCSSCLDKLHIKLLAQSFNRYFSPFLSLSTAPLSELYIFLDIQLYPPITFS